VAIVVLVIGIGLTAVLLLQRSPKFRSTFLAKIEQSVKDSTGAQMQVKDFSLHLSTLTLDIYGIVVHGTEPAGSPPLAQADHLGVGIAIDSLIGRKWHFRNIVLDHPVVQVAVNKAGENNLPKPKQQSSSSTNLFDLGVRQAMLNRGEIYYNDQKSVLTAELHDLGLRVGFDPGQSRYQGHLSYDQGKIQYGAYSPVTHNLDTGFSATPQKFTLDRAESLGERTRFHQRETKAVAFRRGEAESRRVARFAQRPRDLRSRLYDALAAATRAGNNQRILPAKQS